MNRVPALMMLLMLNILLADLVADFRGVDDAAAVRRW